MDYISNSVMMPFIALLSTILIGWVKTPQFVIGEMERNGESFRRKKMYIIMIRYIAPVLMLILFLSTFRVEEKLLNPNQMRTAITNPSPSRSTTPRFGLKVVKW